jgi:hypothetical protein
MTFIAFSMRPNVTFSTTKLHQFLETFYTNMTRSTQGSSKGVRRLVQQKATIAFPGFGFSKHFTTQYRGNNKKEMVQFR